MKGREVKHVCVVTGAGLLLLAGLGCSDGTGVGSHDGSGGAVGGGGVASSGGAAEVTTGGQLPQMSGGAFTGGEGSTGGMVSAGGNVTAAPVCDYETITIQGKVNGVEVRREYDVTSRSVGNFGYSHELSHFGRVSLVWGQALSVGEVSAEVELELYFPRSDATYSEALWCTTGGSVTRHAEHYSHEGLVAANVACPGVPVDGGIAVTAERVMGTVDGVLVDEKTQWVVSDPGRAYLGTGMRLELDDPGEEAASGQVLSGIFKQDGVYYCIGEGTFTRPDPSDDRAMNLTLSGLSRLGSCAELPVVGSLDVCVADPWQTDRP